MYGFNGLSGPVCFLFLKKDVTLKHILLMGVLDLLEQRI